MTYPPFVFSLVINFSIKVLVAHSDLPTCSCGFPDALTRMAAGLQSSLCTRALGGCMCTENKHEPNPPAVAPARRKSSKAAPYTPNAAQPEQPCAAAEPRAAPTGELLQETRAPGAQDKARQQTKPFRSHLKCRRPEKSRLALVKLNTTSESQRVHQYCMGMCAEMYLFHHFRRIPVKI